MHEKEAPWELRGTACQEGVLFSKEDCVPTSLNDEYFTLDDFPELISNQAKGDTKITLHGLNAFNANSKTV